MKQLNLKEMKQVRGGFWWIIAPLVIGTGIKAGAKAGATQKKSC